MSFADRLKELRIDKGLSQQKLADEMGLAKSSISMYEIGEREPSLDVAKRFGDYFDVTTDYLLDRGNRFVERLKELRIEHGISQINLASRVGLSKSTIGAYETGEIKPSLQALEVLADYFNVDIAYLLGKSDAKRQPELMEITQQLENDEELLAVIKKAKDPHFRNKLLQIVSLIDE